MPNMIPIIEIPVKTNRKNQSILMLDKSPIKPNNEFTAMTNNDVPIAFLIGNFANNTSVGIIKKPPPAPTMPANTPITVPSIAING